MKKVAVLTASIIALADALNFDLSDPKTVTLKEPAFESSAQVCDLVDVQQLMADGLLKSQGREDQCLLQFFNGICGGKYMEMGALDGVTFSNTYAFYKSPGLNWRGVMVELIPENYERLIRNRPDEFANVHGAVCNEPTTLHYYAGSSSAVGGVLEFASERHRHQFFGDVKLEDTTPIHCTPLQDILDMVHNDEETHSKKQYFDFFSLDIEGAEMSALESIDWERTAFGILIVESTKGDEQVDEFIRSKGYNQISPLPAVCPPLSDRIGRNVYYINPEFDLIYDKVRRNSANGGRVGQYLRK
eukprot:CAMPEP_0185728492 /NCGR_PEP_ID=MMETSP1171-20130828/3810_1 /TAXON_ID=374046 /ORGANISM="Helicotheca tamensis, Strain CCMP826" /LENGTH=301 /DNA_ID=CAMNT_0028397207 /DNA_START=108 /DNA_END=1013 /DNA_ORIENTATION=-